MGLFSAVRFITIPALLLGTFPFSGTFIGRNLRLQLCSIPAIYTIIFGTAYLPVSYFRYDYRKKQLFGNTNVSLMDVLNNDFANNMVHLMLILLTFTPIIEIICILAKGKSWNKIMRLWTELEDREPTGPRLLLRTLAFILLPFMACLIGSGTMASLATPLKTEKAGPILDIVLFFTGIVETLTITMPGIITCLFAEGIHDHLRRLLRRLKTQEENNILYMKDLRDRYWALALLGRRVAAVMTPQLLVTMLIAILVGIIEIFYDLNTLVSPPEDVDWGWFTMLAVMCILHVIYAVSLILVLSHVPEKASKTGEKIRLYLVQSGIDPDFLALVERCPIRFPVGGYFELNRSIAIAILATVTTYIVILQQFRDSNGDGRNTWERFNISELITPNE